MFISLDNIKASIGSIDPTTVMDCGMMVDVGCLRDEFTSANTGRFIDQVAQFCSAVNADHSFVIGTFADEVIGVSNAYIGNYAHQLESARSQACDASNIFAAIYRAAQIVDPRFGLGGKLAEKVQHHPSRLAIRSGISWDKGWSFPAIITDKFYYLTVITGDNPLAGPGKRAIKQLLARLSRVGFFVRIIHVGTDPNKRGLLQSLRNKRFRMNNDYVMSDPEGVSSICGMTHNYATDTLDFDLPDNQFVVLMTLEIEAYIASCRTRGILTPSRS